MLLICVAAVGCGRQASEPKGKPARPDNSAKIKAELAVEPTSLSRSASQRVTIRVYISNLSDKPNEVEFESTDVYALYAIDEGGRQFRLEREGEPFETTLDLNAKETKFYEVAWDGHIWANREIAYLPPGRYELEARCKKAYSNTEFVWVRD
jgi:hypothetical protein